jgi:hypothetical protein
MKLYPLVFYLLTLLACLASAQTMIKDCRITNADAPDPVGFATVGTFPADAQIRIQVESKGDLPDLYISRTQPQVINVGYIAHFKSLGANQLVTHTVSIGDSSSLLIDMGGVNYEMAKCSAPHSPGKSIIDRFTTVAGF